MRRTIITTLLLAACLIGAQSIAGDCYTALVASPIQLPDESQHEATTLRICRDHLTPVTGLHRAYVDGMAIGIFRSRIRPVEASQTEGSDPSIVFSRGADGRLNLIAAVLPGDEGMQLYEMHTSARVRTHESGAVRVTVVAARRLTRDI